MYIASDYEQQSKTELKTIYFVWSLLHPSKPVEDTSINAKVKIAHGCSNFCLFSHVPHVCPPPSLPLTLPLAL